jgi:hypothetical protein
MAAISQNGEAVEVSCDTLDRVAGDLDLQAAFVKIDVEGAELRVMHGMTTLLARRSCSNILIEMHPSQIRELGGRPDDVPRLLERCGYRLLTSVGDSLVEFDSRDFFASDSGHRFVLATLDGDWLGFKVPIGF